jgi:hypothetical protein
MLSYTNGFQIWSLNQLGGTKEVLSVREGPIKSIKFLPAPLGKESANSPLYGKRPLIAVVYPAHVCEPVVILDFK